MIRPSNGEKALLQWTRGAVVISDTHCDVIRLSREDDQKAKEIAPTHVGNITRIEIPDRMLTESGYIKIECIDKAEDGERIVDRARILIRPQQKPDGYVYGSQESGSWQALRLRMDALERAAREGKFDGKPGKDYILTDEDKQEIADLVEVSGGGSAPGEPGKNGATFIPSVSDSGDLSWSNDGGLPNPETVNIKGQKGDPGYTPQKGVDYFDGEPGKNGTSVTVKSVSTSAVDGGANVVTFSDGKTLSVRNGSKGGKGDPGVGIASVDVFEDSDGNNEVLIALTDGTDTTFTVKNGEDGTPGAVFKPSVSSDGILSWTNTGGLSNPSAVNIKGKDGTSVTVRSVAHSTADGGENVVTFSDGKTMTVRNGSKGGKGDPGDDYVLTEDDKREIADIVISETEKTEYETVDSVEEMTDTSKMYVLSATNTLWAYGEVTTETEPPNKFVPGTATLNQRLSGSTGTVSANSSSVGSFVTDYIAVTDMDSVTPYIARLNYEAPNNAENKVVYYGASKTRLGNTVLYNTSNMTVENGETVCDLKTIYSNGAAPEDWSAVAYVRFQMFVKEVGTTLTSADVANLTITFDADRKTTTEYRWYDTKIPADAASGGGNYLGLLEKINENKTAITDVSERVTALESESGSVTIPSFWQGAVDACIAKIKALQIGKNCVTFPFFSDNHQRNGYAGILIAHIMKECHLPYAFYGGDSISSGYIADEDEMIAQDKAFDTMMSYVPNGRFCRAIGNHDGYWAVDASNKNYYTDAQNYELFLREESVAQNKYFGGEGTYYYVDDLASKVRFVVLDTNDGTVEAEQIAWLRDEALTFSELGWAAVVISHQPISNHYHALISNAAEVISVVNASGVDIIGWFSGHIHRDRIYTGIAVNTSDDTVGDPLGFTQVTITSDNTSIAYDDTTKHPTANDDQSHAIDFVTVNRDTRTVNLTRLGIGNDRSYIYTAAENPYEPVGDYVLTDADKTEIAEIAISKLPVYNGEASEV